MQEQGLQERGIGEEREGKKMGKRKMEEVEEKKDRKIEIGGGEEKKKKQKQKKNKKMERKIEIGEEKKKEDRKIEIGEKNKKEERKIETGGGEEKKMKKKKKGSSPHHHPEEGFIQLQSHHITLKTRKRHSHHLHQHAPEQVKYHLATCSKRQRCKDPDERCVKYVVTSAEEEEEFSFGNLNLNVMELIFNRLNDPFTRIRFSAVCRSWRLVAQSCCTPQFPWLVLQNSCSSFFSLSDGLTHTLRVQEAKGLICSGSFEGWLVMQTPLQAKKSALFLIDPLSKAKIHLPVTVINDSVNRQLVPMNPVYLVYLSSAPISNDGTKNNNCLAAAISMMDDLYLCRLGDKSWIRQNFSEAKHFPYGQVIFNDRSILAIDCWARERVTILELFLESDDRLPTRAKKHSLPFPFGLYVDERVNDIDRYRNLIEWRGELYFVFHEFGTTRDKFETVALHVFKLDSSWNLVKVTNIGDGVIFLVTNVPKCFSVRDFPPSLNLKANCIYYKHPFSNATSIYCLEDGKWEPCPSLSSHQEVPYVWYTPKIRY